MTKQQNLLPDQTLAHKLISKWFWLYLFAFLWLPLGYLIRVIISNDLSVWEVGIIYWLLSLIGLLSIFSSLGLSAWALVYFLPKYYINKNTDYVTTIYKIVRYLNIFMTILFSVWFYFFIKYFWDSYISHPDIETILYIFLAVFVFINLANPIQWIFSSFQNIFIQQVSWFLKQTTITIIVWWIFLFWIWTLFNYSIAFLIWNIIFMLILYYYYKKKYYNEINQWKFIKDKSLYKKLLLFWLNALIASNAMIIINNIDMQMLLIFSNSINAWYYTNYMSLIMIMSLFISPILGLIFPIISELNSKKDISKLSLLQDFFYKYFVFFAFSIWVLLVVFWEVLSLILFWENFLYSGVLLKYLWIFWVFQIIFTINLSILAWIWKLNISRNILVFTMLLNIILNYILIPILWALWAWIATIISWIIIALFSFYYVNKSTKINFDLLFYIKNVSIILMIWVLFYLIIPSVFILENSYRYTNLLYLLFMWMWAYIILALLNIWEIKKFYNDFKKFKKV